MRKNWNSCCLQGLKRRQTEKGHNQTPQSEGNSLIHTEVWVIKMNGFVKSRRGTAIMENSM